MAISLKTAGSWARMVTDNGTVAIPGTPAAGDRMFLFGSWKDQSVTVATPSGWTLVDNFADGAVAAGNGTGSVRNSVYYRDWQSGDAAPAIDYSAAPTEGHWVIMLWQKAGGDTWDAPVARTGAIAAADPFTVDASATVTVPNASVVMGLIGLRDDSTTIARATDAIDDTGALVTWNGNYVESPATHFNSTTGLDMSGDLGHRLVTTGAAGVTLHMDGDPAAAETGAATWVVQGVTVTTDANAGLAEATVAANLAASGLSPSGGVAAATATANDVDATVQTNAGVAAATATANPAAAGVSPNAGIASATATANAATTTVQANVGLAAATGTANQPAASVQTNAGVSAATGIANQPAASIAPTAGVASATAAANNATVLFSKDVAAGLASATAAANQATSTIVVNAGIAQATAAANNATVQTGRDANAGVASVSATAYGPAIAVGAQAGVAAAVTSPVGAFERGVFQQDAFEVPASVAIDVNAAAAQVIAAALDATVQVGAPTPSDEGGILSLMGRRRRPQRVERPSRGRKEEPVVDDDDWIVMV